jgi:hypothetical protein
MIRYSTAKLQPLSLEESNDYSFPIWSSALLYPALGPSCAECMFNIPSHEGAYTSVVPIFSNISSNYLFAGALIKISATCSTDLINDKDIYNVIIKYFFIKMFIYLYIFFQSCCVGLWYISITALSSQYNFISFFKFIPISANNFLNHSSSHISIVIPLNLVSALDKTITFYFLLLHVTKLPPTTNVKYT